MMKIIRNRTDNTRRKVSRPKNQEELLTVLRELHKNDHRLYEFLDRMDRVCGQILRNAGLPDSADYFLKTADGWRKLRTSERPNPPFTLANLALVVIRHEGHDPDSELGYAARVVTLVAGVRQHLRSGNALGAATAGVELGNLDREAETKLVWKQHAISNLKAPRGSRRGSEIADSDRKPIYLQWLKWLKQVASPKPTGPELSEADLVDVVERVNARFERKGGK